MYPALFVAQIATDPNLDMLKGLIHPAAMVVAAGLVVVIQAVKVGIFSSDLPNPPKWSIVLFVGLVAFAIAWRDTMYADGGVAPQLVDEWWFQGAFIWGWMELTYRALLGVANLFSAPRPPDEPKPPVTQ